MPRAPESITTFKAEWNWSDIDQPSFLRLLRNHGTWCERNSGADSPNASLWALLEIHRKQFGKIIVRGVSTAGGGAERQVDDHLAALSEGIIAPHGRELARMSWLEFALNPLPDLFAMPPGGVSAKVKDALLKKRFTDRQIGVAYDYLTRTDHDVMGGMLGLATYGGRINTVARDATASAQRDSILDIACTTGWLDPREEAKNLAWVRAFYRELFADTGGVPVPGDAYGGRVHQSSRHRSRGPDAQYVGRAVAHAVLQGELPAPAADQGALGPAQRVPPCVVHSSRMISLRGKNGPPEAQSELSCFYRRWSPDQQTPFHKPPFPPPRHRRGGPREPGPGGGVRNARGPAKHKKTGGGGGGEWEGGGKREAKR